MANIKIRKHQNRNVSTIKEKIEEAVDELKWGHPETRKAAAIKLGRIRDAEVIPYLLDAMEKDDYMWTRISAIQSLGWIADPIAIKAMIRCVENDPKNLVRKTAINTLGAFKDSMPIPILEKIVNNENETNEIRNAASLAVEVIKGITPDYSQVNE